jgi:hypothetical protein
MNLAVPMGWVNITSWPSGLRYLPPGQAVPRQILTLPAGTEYFVSSNGTYYAFLRSTGNMYMYGPLSTPVRLNQPRWAAYGASGMMREALHTIAIGSGASGTLGSGPTTDAALAAAGNAVNALSATAVCVAGNPTVSAFQTAWSQSTDTTTTGGTQLPATGNYDQPTATALSAALGINTAVNQWCTTFTQPSNPVNPPASMSTDEKVAVGIVTGVFLVGLGFVVYKVVT